MKYEKQTNQNYETMKPNQKMARFLDNWDAAIKLDNAVEEDQIRTNRMNLEAKVKW